MKRRPHAEPSRFWAIAHRLKLAKATMPFWRVVVEVRPTPAARDWPAWAGTAIAAVFAWAGTPEEAEGLAALALEEEGLATVTADALAAAPAAAPCARSAAIARTPLSFLERVQPDAPAKVRPRTLRR